MGKFGLLFIVLVVLQSCVVSKKKYDRQLALTEQYKAEKENCNKLLDLESLTNDSLEKVLFDKINHIELLSEDSVMKDDKIAKLQKINRELQHLYDALNKEKEDINTFADKQKEQFKNSLSIREKSLQELQKKLSKIQEDLDAKAKQNSVFEKDLMADKKRIEELESLSRFQDSTLKRIKNIIANSVSNYGDSLLSVVEKDGNLYVTISDKLLFKSGKSEVNEEGVKALEKIAKALEKTNDFWIYVEGHTDSIPFVSKTGFIKDNWDLSVLRATNVLKILVDHAQLNKARIIPCGRADISPVASNKTAESRSKNRRTEIILKPDYKHIFDLISK